MQEIASGVYVETKYQGANVGLVLTTNGAIVVDTPLIPAEGKDWAKTVSTITDKVLFVFNTDHHRAHIMGNQFFQAPVVAHEFAWKEMLNYKETFIERTKNTFKKNPDIQKQFEETVIIRPQLTFTGQLVLKDNSREVVFMHLGGHTPATSGLYLPKERILFTGDAVVVKEHPALGQAESKEWLNLLSRLRKQPNLMIIPGHGSVTNVEATVAVSEYIRTIRQKVRRQLKSGRSKSEAAVVINQMMEVFPYHLGEKSVVEKRIRAGISRVYDELKSEGGPEEESN